MTRYLTAPKVGVLALISLYGDSIVPTAAIVPLLSFIVSFLIPPKGTARGSPHFENEKLLIDSIGDVQKATIVHASGIPGRTLWDLFLRKLWEINSLDQLHVFFDSLSRFLSNNSEEAEKNVGARNVSLSSRIRFSRDSLFGVYLRRAQLEFTRLQLHDGIALWKSFLQYRNPTLNMWRRRNPGPGRTSYDINLAEPRVDGHEDHLLILYRDVIEADSRQMANSTEDIERLLEFQRDQMQTTGIRVTEDMKRQLEEIIQAGTTVPALLHYVNFLDSWKCGDYPSSFDNLHRFYDYTMHSRDRTFYQYALLNLAILQKDFGCLSEAIAAIHETISTARENKDMGCLNFSLSWLYHLGKTYPTELGEIQKSGVLGTDKEALVFIKAKAKESGMWGLLSTTLLSEARLGLVNVRLKNVVWFACLCNQAEMDQGESVSAALESIAKASHLSLVKNVPSAVASELRIHSSVFSRLGMSYVAWSFEEILFECRFELSSAEEMLQAVCKRSCALALKGRYNDALARMERVDAHILRTLKHQQYWRTCIDLLKLQHALHRDDMDSAKQFLFQLQANPPPDREMAFAIMILEVNVQIRRRNYSMAINLVEKHAEKLDAEEAEILFRILLMTLKARIYDQAGIPQKGFSIAIRAASLAYKARLLPALWQAVRVVCQILNSLKEFDAAARLLRAIMPQVLESEDCKLAATSLSSLADAHMGIAGQVLTGSIKRKEHMTKALGYLEMSFDEFSKNNIIRGQRATLAKKATILHLNRDLVLANDCAARYIAIHKAARDEVDM
ncbi:anaphase promoting complex subunit 5 [Xylographa trunciseda]|nr:anaphase promoting complex subunit 5 [Xylographa trunciseda]